MKICELLLRNFGKFSGRSMQFSEGIQILYGENESGKSTIHTFIKGMLFGMERGRGRAANNDTFTRYEPWENPGCYSGRLVFETGGRHFAIDRNFDKYTKSAQLVCLDDGERLSIEDGDLEVLLDGLTAPGYDNTVSIAQMKARPGVQLKAELKNYATNYYVTGDSDLDLEAALKRLRAKEKEADRGLRDAIKEKQQKRERLEQELSYIWRDIHRIREEQEYLEGEIASRRARMEQEKPEVKQRIFDELRPDKWRVHPVEIIILMLLTILCFLLIPRPWNGFVTIVLFICALIYIWNRMKIAKKQVKTESELILEEITPEEEKIPLEKLVWEYEHNAGELREKQVQYENQQEALAELDEITGGHREYENQRAACQLAAARLGELSESLRQKLRADLDTRISQIMSEITEGKYTHLILEEGQSLSLMSGGRRIPADQVSCGTVEQACFALRMAVGELLHNEEYPVILDDTFVCYDDKRLARTLCWLHENKVQVILFTCQKREEELLRKMGIPFHRITI